MALYDILGINMQTLSPLDMNRIHFETGRHSPVDKDTPAASAPKRGQG